MKTLLILLLMTLALRADVSFTTVNTTNNVATTFTNTIAIPRFNGNLGKLTNITLNIGWTQTRTNHIESLQYDPFDYSVDVSSTVQVLFEDGSIVKEAETHATWFAGKFHNQGAGDDNIRIKGDYMNAKVCVDFSKTKAIWIGTGTIPLRGVMQSTETIFTTPNGASNFHSVTGAGIFSVTVYYFYQPGAPGNGLCQ